MELLDRANTGILRRRRRRPGSALDIRKGGRSSSSPAMICEDLASAAGADRRTPAINVYTHCEMLPAHGYPELKKYPHLAGNFGTAWQSQQKEFENIPAPMLFTTNCLMPPRPSYQDRVYTTSVVGYAGLQHIAAEASTGERTLPP